MSFTKLAFENILDAQNKIHRESLESHDLTHVLELINSTMYVKDKIHISNPQLEPVLNEIVSDVISVVSTALQGHYRLAATGLRSILELGCSTIFYYDHLIEYKLYKDFDFKADKYVSSLINEHSFFKTNYIKTFYPDIIKVEKENDSCSSYISKTYAKLCDIVHGRYLTLTRVDELKIKFNLTELTKFKNILNHTLGCFFVMYCLRFNDFSNPEIMKIVTKTNVLK